MMDEFEQQLRQLWAETCKHPPGSTNRQKGLTKMIRLIVNSGRLWRENSPYYEDALQQTWLYFCRNLCEATTGKQYHPSQGSIINWLNSYLKRRLQDFRIQAQQAQAIQAKTTSESGVEQPDPVEQLPAPPYIPPILEITKQWAETDLNGKLRRIHIQGKPEVNCQILILKRLPPETSWTTLAAEFNIPTSTLIGFYRRQCIPLLRKFGESQGYL
jgi:hypothetical protein